MTGDQTPSTVALVSGGAAGTAVDVALFPLDTVKTRLQSSAGFWKAGGFRNIYAGLGPAALGSAPGAALFFCTYESSKNILRDRLGVGASIGDPAVHMISASLGEIGACLVRVPIEVVKQRRQADAGGASAAQIMRTSLREEGFFRGLFRGYGTTVLREIPFSLIQFPLWEFLKATWLDRARRGGDQRETLAPWQSAVCGSVAGGISASITTPLDVAKTRIMLSEAGSHMARRASTAYAIKVVWRESGFAGLFSGVAPRTALISLGGFIFFGAYDKVKSICSDVLKNE